MDINVHMEKPLVSEMETHEQIMHTWIQIVILYCLAGLP